MTNQRKTVTLFHVSPPWKTEMSKRHFSPPF
uniref:Uncharacterized protein n=1 Tax=Anguilla anguilla TaxID=7936 RepID=A0A0E9W9J2_ANGAN